MRVDFECWGGYVSVHLRYRVETADLPDETAKKIERLVDASKVLDREPEIGSPPARVPDVVSYRLNLQDGGRTASLSCTDVTAPPEVLALMSCLRRLALEARAAGSGGGE